MKGWEKSGAEVIFGTVKTESKFFVRVQPTQYRVVDSRASDSRDYLMHATEYKCLPDSVDPRRSTAR